MMNDERTLDDLRSMVSFASATAEKIFRKTGEIHPMYHAIKASGETVLIPGPDSGNKDFNVALIKAAFERENIDRYVFMDEAWILNASNSSPVDLEKIMRIGLRNHPDRREAVVFSAANRQGAMLTATRFILRPEHGRPRLAPLRIDNMESFTSSYGRMVGLLNRGDH